MKNIFPLLIVLCCFGCTKLKDEVSSSPSMLPPNAINVEYLDDHWGTFEVELNGKVQKILFTEAGTNDSRSYILLNGSDKVPVSDSKFRCPQCGARIVITELGPVQITEKP